MGHVLPCRECQHNFRSHLLRLIPDKEMLCRVFADRRSLQEFMFRLHEAVSHHCAVTTGRADPDPDWRPMWDPPPGHWQSNFWRKAGSLEGMLAHYEAFRAGCSEAGCTTKSHKPATLQLVVSQTDKRRWDRLDPADRVTLRHTISAFCNERGRGR